MFASLNCFATMFRRDKQSQNSVGKSREDFSIIQGVHIFSYKDLKLATRNFHPDNKIGAGGFGTVYKGVLKDGTQVAVKQLSAESRQGVREFLTEIATISAIKHENLVMLHGCCIEEDNRILVYGYLENNSITHALFGSSNGAINLDWQTRSKICIGTACGLVYLHEELTPYIVHRDIKASNILLDRDFNPKIADFGLAKLFPDNITHISTRVAGTIGYLAPEYGLRGHLTRKADVYSFGVLVLEIISGRRNMDTSVSAEEQILLEMIARVGGSKVRGVLTGRSVAVHQSRSFVHSKYTRNQADHVSSGNNAVRRAKLYQGVSLAPWFHLRPTRFTNTPIVKSSIPDIMARWCIHIQLLKTQEAH